MDADIHTYIYTDHGLWCHEHTQTQPNMQENL